MDGFGNNPEKSSTSKIGEHIPCGYSISTIWRFDHIENKHTLYPGKDCIKQFCSFLRKYAKNIIAFEKQKNLLLAKEKLKSYQHAKVGHICWKNILKKYTKDKNYRKVRDHCHYRGKYRDAADSICNFKFNVPNESL